MTRTRITGYWIQIAIALALLWPPSPSRAATVTAIAVSPSINAGESTEIQVWLNLEVGEEASIFEGRFDLVGSGSAVEPVTGSDLVPGGPSWGTSFGGIVGSQAQVSLTSSNAGGSRLVATLTVTGLGGTFQLKLGSGTFVQRDLNVSPFFEDVPLSTPVGTVLVTVTVPLDSDGDGILDEADNCPFVPNAPQTNSDSQPAGDVCQCGDVNNDFIVDGLDVQIARENLLGSPLSGSFHLERCNVIGTSICGIDDIFVINHVALGLPVNLQNACDAYSGP